MRSLYRLAPLALLLLAPHGAQAAGGVTFSASVDRDRLEVGETLTLEVTVTVADRNLVGQLTLPTHPGFERVSAHKSSQMSFSFGSGGQSLLQTEVHTLILRAVKTGAQTITPGVLDYGGKTYNTRAVVVTVLKAGQGQRPSPGQPQGPGTVGGLGGLAAASAPGSLRSLRGLQSPRHPPGKRGARGR